MKNLILNIELISRKVWLEIQSAYEITLIHVEGFMERVKEFFGVK